METATTPPPAPVRPVKSQPETPTPPSSGENKSTDEKNDQSNHESPPPAEQKKADEQGQNQKVYHEPSPPPPPPGGNQENNKTEQRNEPKANPDQGAPEQDYRVRVSKATSAPTPKARHRLLRPHRHRLSTMSRTKARSKRKETPNDPHSIVLCSNALNFLERPRGSGRIRP